MKILVDAVQDSEAVTGTDRVARNVLARLPALLPDCEFLVGVRSRNGFVSSGIQPSTNVRIIEPPVVSGRRPWLLGTMPLLAQAWRPQLTLGLYNCALPPVGPGRSICTVYDLIPFRLAQDYYPGAAKRLAVQTVMRRSLSRADGLALVSETTRNDVTEFLGRTLQRSVIASPGVDPAFTVVPPHEVQRVRAKWSLPDRFVLTIGSREPRKNLDAALAAHRLLSAEKRVEAPLIVVGSAWGGPGASRVTDPAIRELGFVDEADLPGLYAAASVFLFLSRFEGFGLPPLEAMACQTATVCSNRTSLPEVVGDAAILVDPQASHEIAACLARLLSEPVDQERMARGVARAAEFSYDRTAAAYAELIRAVA